MLMALAPLLMAQAAPSPPPPDTAAVVAQLNDARAMLCPACNNDLEREGVNRPARRSMIGADKLETAQAMMAGAPGLPGLVPASRQLRYAIELLAELDEAAADRAIGAAIRVLESARRVALGGPPEPWPVMTQLRLARRFVCDGCGEGAWQAERRARAAAELAVAAAMLDAAPTTRRAVDARQQAARAAAALAMREDRMAGRAIDAAIAAMRPLPR